jgi:MATE family multidrug resistance protein
MPARAGESMLRRLLNISGPFFLGSLARLSVTICTTVLVGRIGSSVQLAAIGFATVMCNITGHSMVQGMGAALDTLSSQAFGAGQVPKLGMLAQRSFAISLCMVCLPASILWIAIAPLMRSAGMDAELADQVGQFALWRIPGLVTQCAYVSLAKTLNAQRMTKPGAQAPSLYHAVFLPPLRFFTFTYLKGLRQLAGSPPVLPPPATFPLPCAGMYCSWIACPIGLSCTYVAVVYLRLGLAGAAASATLRDVVQLLLLAVGAWKFCPEFRACWEDGLFDVRALQEWPRYMKLGFASLIICCVSWWSWDAATVLCSRLPENTTTMLATQTVVVNIISLLYLAPGAVARGASALVGSALGANNAYEAKCAFHASAFAVVVVVIAQSSVLYALRHEAGYLFTQDEEVVTEVASILAPWGVAFASVGGIQCGLSGVVEGVRTVHTACLEHYARPC